MMLVYAAGVGRNSNKAFMKRQAQVLGALTQYEGKLNCLCNAEGTARFQHPLSPTVRTWYLAEMRIAELPETTSTPTAEEIQPKKRGRPKK